MPKFVKNDAAYNKLELNTKAIKRAYDKVKKAKKFPTSVNLAEETVAELKSIAQVKGIPYQTLMRMLIVEGLDKLRKSA